VAGGAHLSNITNLVSVYHMSSQKEKALMGKRRLPSDWRPLLAIEIQCHDLILGV